MIEIFTGIQGSGKTLHAVSRILDCLENGGSVATNIELHKKNIRRYLHSKNKKYVPQRIIELDTKEKLELPHKYIGKGTDKIKNLIVLDELAILSPARKWQKTHEEFFHFLLMIRRAKTDVIMICQRISQIDKQFRNMFQFRWNFNNLGRALIFPVLGKFPWQIIIRVQYDQTDHLLSAVPSVINHSIANCYNTEHEVVKFDRGKVTKEREVKTYDKMVIRRRLLRMVFKRMCRQNIKSCRIFFNKTRTGISKAIRKIKGIKKGRSNAEFKKYIFGTND